MLKNGTSLQCKNRLQNKLYKHALENSGLVIRKAKELEKPRNH